ncbi:MAG: zf-HC2 domain-containing protein, partial [Dehalococcoidia bacterium]
QRLHMNKLSSWLMWPMTGGLTHDEIQEQASEYVEDSLPRLLAARFRFHLRSCEKCNAFVATLRAMILTMRDAPLEGGPADLAQRIRDRISEDGDRGGQGSQPA